MTKKLAKLKFTNVFASTGKRVRALTVLFVIPENQPIVVKSCRNVPNVVVRSAQGVGTYDIVASDVLLLTRKAVDALMLARGDKAES